MLIVVDETVEKIEKEIGLGGLLTEEMAFLENYKNWADGLKTILIVIFVLIIVALTVLCILEAKKEQPEKEKAKEESSFPSSLIDFIYTLIGTIGIFTFGWFIYQVIELIKLVSYEHRLVIVRECIEETTSAMRINAIIFSVSFAITTALIIRKDSKRQSAKEDLSRV
jgi:uncharacterized membrane protein YesL